MADGKRGMMHIFGIPIRNLAVMRLRFTIRDLLWLTALAAVSVGWWLDHRHQGASHEQYKHNLSLMSPTHTQDALQDGWTDEQVERTAAEDAEENQKMQNGTGFFGGGFGWGRQPTAPPPTAR